MTSVNADKNKPEIILSYHATKGAVDTFDKMIVTYSCRQNARRWPLNVFFFILDAAALNTFVLYAEKNPEIMVRNKKKTAMFTIGVTRKRPLQSTDSKKSSNMGAK